MKCKYLNQFRLSEFGWTVESCTANDRPYAPSISDLHDYCKGSEFKKCPVLLKTVTSIKTVMSNEKFNNQHSTVFSF
jgi:hypothetical protein